MQKRIQHKLRVKKALKKREGVRNFKPTVAQAQSWFSVQNRALFGNRLWMPDIYVKGIHNARQLRDAPSSEIMKLIVSGGVTNLEN